MTTAAIKLTPTQAHAIRSLQTEEKRLREMHGCGDATRHVMANRHISQRTLLVLQGYGLVEASMRPSVPSREPDRAQYWSLTDAGRAFVPGVAPGVASPADIAPVGPRQDTREMSLIDVIDRIRELRAEADAMERGDTYDPCGYTKALADETRREADAMEVDMHRRLGWWSR